MTLGANDKMTGFIKFQMKSMFFFSISTRRMSIPFLKFAMQKMNNIFGHCKSNSHWWVSFTPFGLPLRPPTQF